MYIYIYIYLCCCFKRKRKPKQFYLIRLPFAHHTNGNLSFVRLLTKKQTEVCPSKGTVRYWEVGALFHQTVVEGGAFVRQIKILWCKGAGLLSLTKLN